MAQQPEEQVVAVEAHHIIQLVLVELQLLVVLLVQTQLLQIMQQ
jgi:hypothetical protein